ncbi:MAG: nuclear transport factor 2 family protein [Acidobacteriota bacterium]
MIRRLLFPVLIALIPLPAAAASEEASVIRTVQRFFDAMASHDAAAARDVLLDEGRFVSIRSEQGEVIVGGSTHREFLQRLAGMKTGMLERMWNPAVRLHGRLATLWTAYDFHRGGQFSHCGIDSFSLVRTAAGWKIAGAVYTVESTGCPPSPLGPVQ